jgi:hypothetical protein
MPCTEIQRPICKTIKCFGNRVPPRFFFSLLTCDVTEREMWDEPRLQRGSSGSKRSQSRLRGLHLSWKVLNCSASDSWDFSWRTAEHTWYWLLLLPVSAWQPFISIASLGYCWTGMMSTACFRDLVGTVLVFLLERRLIWKYWILDHGSARAQLSKWIHPGSRYWSAIVQYRDCKVVVEYEKCDFRR